jgi:signal recognition particle subunit SRP14
MVLLENEPFLLELTRLFLKSRSKGAGAVRVTMKRYDGRTKPVPKKVDESKKQNKKKGGQQQQPKMGKRPPPNPSASVVAAAPSEFSCLFHARLGNSKVSTVVHPKDVNKFQLAYCSVLKGNMDSLQKLRKKPARAGAPITAKPAAAAVVKKPVVSPPGQPKKPPGKKKTGAKKT